MLLKYGTGVCAYGFNLNNMEGKKTKNKKQWVLLKRIEKYMGTYLKTQQKPSVQCPRFKSLKQKSNQEKTDLYCAITLHMKLIAMVKICITSVLKTVCNHNKNA